MKTLHAKVAPAPEPQVDKRVPLSTSLPPEENEWLTVWAAKEQRTIASAARLAICTWIAQMRNAEAGGKAL